MPRNLPWKRQRLTEPDSEPEPAPRASVQTPSRPAPVTASPRPSASSRRSVSTPRDIKSERTRRLLKSPSTSPPPEPLSETFMVEVEDDRFRMVDDELVSIAHKFTAHLHAAEYHRQKQQAKTRNADTIDTICRPVVGRMTPSVLAKQDRLTKSKRKMAGVRKALINGRGSGLEVESEGESPWVGTSLQGLMEAPQESTMRLSRLVSVGPSAKASARSSQGVKEAEDRVTTNRPPVSRPPAIRPPPRATGGGRSVPTVDDNITDDSDEDLDVPAKRPTLPVLPRPRPAASTAIDQDQEAAHPTSHTPRRHYTWPQKHGESAQGAKDPTTRDQDQTTKVPLLSDSDDDLLAGLRRRRQESKAPRASRRGNARPAPPTTTSAGAAQGLGKKPEANSDIIPSFL